MTEPSTDQEPAVTVQDWLRHQDGLYRRPPAQSPLPTPPPSTPVTDIYAWMIVAVPLFVPLVDVGLPRALGIEPNTYLVNAAFVLVYLGTGLSDVWQIEASGRNVRGIHLRGWAILLPPVYLIQRARALGQSFVIFFAWLGAAAVSLALEIFFLSTIYWVVTGSLPGCHTPFTTARAKAVFETLRDNTGWAPGRALYVANVVEKTASAKLVSCEATIYSNDTRTYYVVVVHERQGWQIYTKLGVYAVR